MTTTTIPHHECHRVGKFDCAFDAYVFNAFGDEGNPGDGHVEAPTAWWGEFTLDDEAEPGFAEHFGGRHLILREFFDGHTAVEVFATAEMRQERLDALEEAFEHWDYDALTDED